MIKLALNSQELEAFAAQLATAAINLAVQSHEQVQSWRESSALSDAESLLAGFNLLEIHNQPRVTSSEQMLQVSGILIETAGLTRILETYMAAMEQITEHSPLVSIFLQQITHLGDLLDFMCAKEIEALCTQIAAEPIRYLEDFQDLPASSIHEYNLLHAPLHIKELALAHPNMSILEVGHDTLVVAFGDIDTSTSTATVVAGVGSSNPSSWPTYLNRANTVYTSTGAATVMWLGYKAPESIPRAISGSAAATAGTDLRRFHTALSARNPTQRNVVVGYSYGSTVVGSAARHGMDADALVLVGSPGVEATHARELGDAVFAVTGSRDPIGLASTNYDGIHGKDPTSTSFGATVWESGSNHSEYWEDPAFLHELGQVLNDK